MIPIMMTNTSPTREYTSAEDLELAAVVAEITMRFKYTEISITLG